MMARSIAGALALISASAAFASAAEVTADGGRLVLPGSGCVLVNNVWDRAATPQGYTQSVFADPLPGWRWDSPGKSTRVLAMPEIVCGDKPWDPPQKLRPEFPFRAGEKAPVVRFDVDLKAEGTYNMAVSLWAVSRLPAVQQNIALEIMIWNVAHGQKPVGRRIGDLRTVGTVFDLYLKTDQGMVTGPDPFTWPMVQFVAAEPILKGSLPLRPFLDALIQRGILAPDHWLTDIELGNEVTEGRGTVTLRTFSVDLR